MEDKERKKTILVNQLSAELVRFVSGIREKYNIPKEKIPEILLVLVEGPIVSNLLQMMPSMRKKVLTETISNFQKTILKNVERIEKKRKEC